ncbi:YgiW/YdeI family stress tolerance OB fold protein [Dongshaea marina]|uniref:YgiW/YdeI family stress tolerance OB fold protein n=1 Tax=Dongshaea marina TaxID=2047966 RepID=UPI000D3EDB29|nr:NirD/YgiW/YdeI family stress tolerance protein [Dongshaea marina]
MKKMTIIAASLALSSTAAFADFNGSSKIEAAASGGFVGSKNELTTVEKAKEQSDDTWVTLQGHIEKQVGNDEYIFRDSTGSINVDIDRKHWKGQVVTPYDKVEIKGDIDKDWNSVEIDVKEINKVVLI